MKAFRGASSELGLLFMCSQTYRCDTECWRLLYIIHTCKISSCNKKDFSASPSHFSSAIYCFIKSASGLAAVSRFSFEALPWLNNAGADWRVKIPMPAWPQTLIREKCWAHTLQPPGLPPRSLTEHPGSLRNISITDRGEEFNGPNWELGEWGQRPEFQGTHWSVHSLFSLFLFFQVYNCKGQVWYCLNVKKRKERGQKCQERQRSNLKRSAKAAIMTRNVLRICWPHWLWSICSPVAPWKSRCNHSMCLMKVNHSFIQIVSHDLFLPPSSLCQGLLF